MLDEISFLICEKAETDARLIMKWRNDPTTLQMFYHSEPKVWPDFYTEYKQTYFTKKPLPVFAVLHQEKIAFLKFDPSIEPHSIEISINLAPNSRRQGLASKILSGVESYLAEQKIKTIFAEVKTKNIASARSFEKAKYKQISKTQKRIIDTNEEVEIFRYVRKID